MASTFVLSTSGSAHATPASRIIGGQLVETCGFPNVVSLDRGGMGCTGTLVHPKLVMTAAHCFMMGGTARTVHFGERRGARSRTARIEKCVPHPNWSKTKEVGGTDIAYCVLKEEVKDVPITPILMGCETEVLKKGTPVVIAGYGLTRPPGGYDSDDAARMNGGKHWTETRYIETLESGELKAAIVGSKGKQGCKGDSGGPVFVKLPEDKYGKEAGWRVFGVTSGQRSDTDPECTTGTGTYAMMHEWIATVEKETGLDLTPCFDADGTWNPGPDCHSAPRELDTTAAGSWPGSCEAGPLTDKITSCGKQDGQGPEDEDKPKDKSQKGENPESQQPDDNAENPKSEQPGEDAESPKSEQPGEDAESQEPEAGSKNKDPKAQGEKNAGGCATTKPRRSSWFLMLLVGAFGMRSRSGRGA